MKALVLSAGQGRRLLPLTADEPKCLLPVDGDACVLELQLRALARGGVDHATVVVGFGAERVRRLLDALSIPDLSVETIYNPFYAVSDNLATCWLARQRMDGDFLLLNGDTLFEDRLLRRVLEDDSAPISVAIDHKEVCDDDDMKVCVDETGRLLAISKTLDPRRVNGESIGLICFRGSGPKSFSEALERGMRRESGIDEWYLSAIDELAREMVVQTTSVRGLWWREIDSPDDLEEVRRSLPHAKAQAPAALDVVAGLSSESGVRETRVATTTALKLDRIVLSASVPAAEVSGPPVRIFLGTEHGQSRAERVFVWSIEQARDPRRRYEIFLMKDLPGFDRRRWLTGFTNYRFMIPHLTDGAGRAIYNDVDQIYLGDPAALFDTDMGEHGFLSINPYDTSVMLIDCTRMAGIWTPELARRRRRKAVEKQATSVPGLWGRLDETWNSRDTEYEAGRTRLLHYTTIHTQPWLPFPRRFVYQTNPLGYLWHDLEHSADRAGFHVFSAARPSASHTALLERLRETGPRPLATNDAESDALEAALSEAGARTVLEFGLGRLPADSAPSEQVRGRAVTRHDPAVAGLDQEPHGHFDAVVCRGGLESLADEDVAWVVDGLFRLARRLVHASIEPGDGERNAEEAARSVARDRFWWSRHFEAASIRHPGVHWKIVATRRRRGRATTAWLRERPARGGLPRVWVLCDDKPGHTQQSTGLAEALGWPYELKELSFQPLNRLSNRMLGASRLSLRGRSRARLAPPWPDLVIATGRRVVPVARWVAEQSRGHTRLVQIGRKGGNEPTHFDLVVSCAHFRQPAHARRLEVVAPTNSVTDEALRKAAERWQELFPRTGQPPIALLVGGTCATHRLDAESARRMGREVREFARSAGRSVVAVTSRRTEPEAARALEDGLGDACALFYHWRPGDANNPYQACLAMAGALVVTGDSESMLGEAAAAGRPLYIYPVPARRSFSRRIFTGWIADRAEARPRKRRKGTVRPQQGLEALCARLISRGWVHVPRKLERLHQGLVEAGVARMFGEPFAPASRGPLREVLRVADRVRELMGIAVSSAAEDLAERRAAGPEVADRRAGSPPRAPGERR
jgi:mitochondrial fission protein ELM1/choline kinase